MSPRSAALSLAFANVGHLFTHMLMLLYPTVVLALEGRARNIAVNSITPGVPIDGPLAHTYSDAQRRVMVKPQALAPAFRFLSEIDASFSTGNRLSAYQIAQVLAVGSGPGAAGG